MHKNMAPLYVGTRFEIVTECKAHGSVVELLKSHQLHEHEQSCVKSCVKLPQLVIIRYHCFHADFKLEANLLLLWCSIIVSMTIRYV